VLRGTFREAGAHKQRYSQLPASPFRLGTRMCPDDRGGGLSINNDTWSTIGHTTTAGTDATAATSATAATTTATISTPATSSKTPKLAKTNPTTTAATTTAATTTTPATSSRLAKANPGTTAAANAKTPAKNSPASKPLPPIKTPVASKKPAPEDDKPRLSKRQKKKLRAEESEVKEGGSTPSRSQKKGPVLMPSGLQYEDTLVGKGDVATKGNRLQMRYKGTLATGQVFDSNMPRGRPFAFKLGAGEVIRGWDEGLQGMRVGGKRTLKIPSALGYGSRGAGPKIPPNANLTFEVELVSKS